MGATMVKRFVWLLVLVFAVAFVITAPVQAAEVVRGAGETAGSWLSAAARSFMTFLTSLIS
jgi:hypothetical protein